MKYRLKVLSPLSIGNGNKYMPFEYIKRGNETCFIDIMKLLKSNSKNRLLVDSVTGAFDSGNFRWDDIQRRTGISLDDYITYKAKLYGITSIRGEIVSFIKTAGRPYIPGSSIKGAVRSCITRSKGKEIIGDYRKSLLREAEKVRESFNTSRKYSADEKRIDDFAEREHFGNPNDSPFRFLKISDSGVLGAEKMTVSEIKILNICNGAAKWYNRRENVQNPADAVSIYTETLDEGTEANGYISIDNTIDNQYIMNEGKIKNYGLLKNLTSCIQEDIEAYIQGEIKFYSKYGLTELENFYKNIRTQNENLKDNEMIIQIGFSTGYLAKTLGRYLKDEDIKSLKLVTSKKVYEGVFPKTRRIILKGGKPHTIPGWIKLILEGE